MTITLSSFGFKHRPHLPGALTVLCTQLANPHKVARLRALTGQDSAVAEYLSSDLFLEPTLGRARDLVERGANHIAFACYGGKHRSVYVAERFAQELRAQGHSVTLRHLDL